MPTVGFATGFADARGASVEAGAAGPLTAGVTSTVGRPEEATGSGGGAGAAALGAFAPLAPPRDVSTTPIPRPMTPTAATAATNAPRRFGAVASVVRANASLPVCAVIPDEAGTGATGAAAAKVCAETSVYARRTSYARRRSRRRSARSVRSICVTSSTTSAGNCGATAPSGVIAPVVMTFSS